MAEAVIVGIAGKIVAYLVPQALENVQKLCGIKHELEVLKDTVSTLQAVLDHAEEQYHRSPQIKVWVDKLKEALYDAQDVLEEFNIEAMRRELRGHNETMKEVRTFFSSSNQLAFKMKMSYQLRAVRGRIEAIKADKGFHLEERPEREWRKREETHSFIREGDIIGRDDDKKTVIKFLLDSNVQENISILPIVGIGGLGKTALAQCVYNDEMVSKQFNLKMWVCVSDDFDKAKIMKNMIACAKKKDSTEIAMEQLQSELRREIDGKRYLLVLDDLWKVERETWLSLQTLLLGGARGSKILITTRLPLVANITGTTLPHLLGSLSESASLELLMRMACCKGVEIQDPDMLAIGKDIVRKCSRVPLAIRTIGSLLFKKSKLEWLQFKENELPDVSKKEDGIISILKLSYDHLPSHLKQCFAFCSLFPKDYEIKKKTLVDLWIAEGFIEPTNGRQYLEDIAHGYIMDLLWSNFFQDLKEDPYTNEETCKMHDLMHDLACLVAGSGCWVARDDTKSINERTRHISYGSTFNLMDDLPISRFKASALRTIASTIRYGEEYKQIEQREATSEADLHQLIQNFKRLRILDLQYTKVEKAPRSICKLKHLTYLNLSGNHTLKRLPNSITKLQSLQTLNLNHCHALEELPSDIRKFISLQNLDIYGCFFNYMPRGLGKLSSLHRLERFILPKNKAHAKKYCGLGELNGLNNIQGSLCIENLESVIDAMAESKTANLIGKHSLKSLTLKWGDSDTNDAIIRNRDEALLDGLRLHENLRSLIIEGYKGESFPRWMTDLPNLVELNLLRCTGCKHFPQFGLKNLKLLYIRGMKFLEYLPGDCLKNLTSLEFFKISGFRRLTSLPLGLWHLSKLVHLSFSNCEQLDLSKDESGNFLDFHGGLQSLRFVEFSEIPKLESLPQWLLQLINLERLHIYHCYNLKALSEQIEALQSLQQLVISRCPSLTSLPEGMQRLTSLNLLQITWCPELEKRCQRDVGEDWDKIKHISKIVIVA